MVARRIQITLLSCSVYSSYCFSAACSNPQHFAVLKKLTATLDFFIRETEKASSRSGRMVVGEVGNSATPSGLIEGVFMPTFGLRPLHFE